MSYNQSPYGQGSQQNQYGQGPPSYTQGGYNPQQNYGGQQQNYPQQGGYNPQQNYGGQQQNYPQQGGYNNPQQNYGGQQQNYPQRGQQQNYPQQGQQQNYPQQGQQQNYPQQGQQQGQQLAQGGQGGVREYYGQVGNQEMQMLRQWFQAIDKDNSNSIDANELSQLPFGVNQEPLGLEMAKKFLRVFDKDASGEISFEEYASLHKFLSNLQTSFLECDQRKARRLTAEELKQALSKCGFNFGMPAIKTLITKFSSSRDGIAFSEYTALCAHIATLKNIFEWNDRQKRGKVEFSFENLCQIVTHCMDKPNIK